MQEGACTLGQLCRTGQQNQSHLGETGGFNSGLRLRAKLGERICLPVLIGGGSHAETQKLRNAATAGQLEGAWRDEARYLGSLLHSRLNFDPEVRMRVRSSRTQFFGHMVLGSGSARFVFGARCS